MKTLSAKLNGVEGRLERAPYMKASVVSMIVTSYQGAELVHYGQSFRVLCALAVDASGNVGKLAQFSLN